MRIGLDARWIFKEISGIGAYTLELIRHLAQRASEHEFILFFRDPVLRDRTWEDAELQGKAQVRAKLVPWGIFSPWNQLRMPALLRRLRLDVFHSPNYMIPLPAFPRRRPHRVKCVVTIHDLIPLLFPELTPRALKTRLFPLFRRIFHEVGARTDLFLTVSEVSRQDLVRCLRLPPGREMRVRAIPNGVAPEYRPAPRMPRPNKTILYVGRFDPYKNLPGLIDVFHRVRDRARFDVRLRIIGPPDERYPEGRQRARALNLDSAIEWSGYVAGPELVAAYQQADVFALLSLYEGFGLTVLEAMACGTPVVCSNIGALKEVGGDAAVFVDPRDYNAAAAALLRILGEPNLAAELSRKGLERAALFTWEQTAALTLKAYEEIATPS